jgi:ribonuclease HI
MTKKSKYYTVWKGHVPGVYKDWESCKLQIHQFEGAQYKSFNSLLAAQEALKTSYQDCLIAEKNKEARLTPKLSGKFGTPRLDTICVDAASSGNPGLMEYRGVDTHTGEQLFYQGPYEESTNNIGEFLAIVHALAFLKKVKIQKPIYSDSKTAMSWVTKKKCNTKLQRSKKNSKVFELIHRAEQWLNNNPVQVELLKWHTKAWGEIPADFGRK